MRLFVRYWLLPALLASAAAVGAFLSLVRQQEDRFEPLATDFTMPVLIALAVMLVLTAIQSTLVLAEQRRQARTVRVAVRLQGLTPPRKLPNTWREDPMQLTGLLRVSLTLGQRSAQLLSRYVRYGELVSPQNPGEITWGAVIPDSWLADVRRPRPMTVRLEFEPNRSAVISSLLYEGDLRGDVLLDASRGNTGKKECVITSQSFGDKWREYTAWFEDPTAVLRVLTDAQPHCDDEEELPIVTRIPDRIIVSLNDRELIHLATDKLEVRHNFIMGGRLGPFGRHWSLFHYTQTSDVQIGCDGELHVGFGGLRPPPRTLGRPLGEESGLAHGLTVEN